MLALSLAHFFLWIVFRISRTMGMGVQVKSVPQYVDVFEPRRVNVVYFKARFKINFSSLQL